MIVAKLFKLTFYGILVRRKIVIYSRQHIRGKVVLFINSLFFFQFCVSICCVFVYLSEEMYTYKALL